MDFAPLPPPVLPNRDDENLKLLALFHYIVAGLGAFFACLPLIHVFMGVMMATDPSFFAGSKGAQTAPPPAIMGYFFAGFGALMVLLGWGMAVCTFVSGRLLAKRRKRMFSFVLAALLCGFFPFGTLLGVFTIIVLSRESVIRSYARRELENGVRA